jgi:glutamate-1-semialdehyde 2,1-aminomutase
MSEMSSGGSDRVSRASRVPRQMDLYKRACRVIPGGTQLISRRPSRFAAGVSPVYAASANGARFTDIEGNEYIDWVSGIGAIILGYCDPVVDAAVIEQIRQGAIYSVNHPLEVELAEELIDAIPCAEMVRYTKGGGEACAVAVRIARGATGREKVLFCGYHGWHDWYLAANLMPGALDSHLFPQIDPVGVPAALEGTAIPFPYGDLAALQSLLDEHDGQIAAVIMEPLRSETPPPGYLEGVRRLTADRHVVLIFDEVSTGLRFSSGGVQPAVGVSPDMAVFAKSLSNGYAMGAVVGRRAVMESAARMFISSTYWSDTVGLRAALTTLREVRIRDVPTRLRQTGQTLQSRLNEVASRTGCPVRCTGLDVHPQLTFAIDDERLRSQVGTLYIQEMARRGCHGYTSFYLNAAQGESEIEQTVAAAGETFALITEALQRGTVEQVLECQRGEESFRRLVR